MNYEFSKSFNIYNSTFKIVIQRFKNLKIKRFLEQSETTLNLKL
jgi:hypothetical protein